MSNSEQIRRRDGRAWVLGVLVITLGCSGGTANGTPPPGSPPQVRTTPQASGQSQGQQSEAKVAVSPAALRESGVALARPRKLPTIAPILWDRFPNDRTGPYGSSGRKTHLKPGKPGILAAAVMSARKGDTILLQGGTYMEGPADDDMALRIDVDNLVIRSVPGQRARIIPQGPVTKRGIIIGADNVMLHGLDIEGFTAAGIGIGTPQKTVKGTILSDLRLNLPGAGQWVDGISIWPDFRSRKTPVVDGLLIRDVKVIGASLGISCNAGPCNNLWLENVLVQGAPGTGSGADAVAVESGENVVLVNVEVSGASADGIDIKASRVLIWGCTVHNVQRNGVKLWAGGDVVNTVIHHTGADASVVLFAGKYRLVNSLVAFHNYDGNKSYNLTAGHGIREGLEVSLINSIFYNTSGGMYFADQAKVEVSHCLFSGIQNGNLMRVHKGGKVVNLTPLALGARTKALGLGEGNRVGKPGFVDPAKGNFQLKAGSVAVDGGRVAMPYAAEDRLGNPRVVGKAPDIGPFELGR